MTDEQTRRRTALLLLRQLNPQVFARVVASAPELAAEANVTADDPLLVGLVQPVIEQVAAARRRLESRRSGDWSDSFDFDDFDAGGLGSLGQAEDMPWWEKLTNTVVSVYSTIRGSEAELARARAQLEAARQGVAPLDLAPAPVTGAGGILSGIAVPLAMATAVGIVVFMLPRRGRRR